MENRVKWIDTAKFLGIFAIYLGHFGSSAGFAYPFVFSYHVAFFFLLSGCMSNYDKTSFGKFVIKKTKNIMIPFWFFCALSVLVYTLHFNLGIDVVKDSLKIIFKGCIRNEFFAASLWFLSCLFIMEILFKILKFLKFKWVILLVCIFSFVLAETVLDPRPIAAPSWWYNLDSALYYIIFFGIGYVSYPLITKLFTLDTLYKKIIFAVSGVFSLVFASLVFFNSYDITTLLDKIPFIRLFSPVVRALIIIWLNLIVAKTIENISLLNQIGQNTLYLCGSEYISKAFISLFLGLVGLNITVSYPLQAFIYSFILLLFGWKVLAPLEKRAITKINQLLTIKSPVLWKKSKSNINSQKNEPN